MSDRTTRILIAETVGTFILMLGGPGTAVFAADALGVLGVALGFGLSLLVAAYLIGPVSGCHINPAVTVGLVLAKKVDRALVPFYVGGQLVGALLGGLTIWVIRNGAFDDFDANPATFAANLWGAENGFYNFGAMLLAEVILTGLLVVVVLGTTRRGFPAGAVGVTVGLTLTLIHLISIPIDNTSVNPARSFGMAVFAGGAALEQLWAFVLFPLVGAAAGALLWAVLADPDDGDEVIDLADESAEVAAAAPASPVAAASSAPGSTGSVVLRHPYGPGSHATLDDAVMPDGYPVKAAAGAMHYHVPGSGGYEVVIAEVWFDTVESAEAAGFSPAPPEE